MKGCGGTCPSRRTVRVSARPRWGRVIRFSGAAPGRPPVGPPERRLEGAGLRRGVARARLSGKVEAVGEVVGRAARMAVGDRVAEPGVSMLRDLATALVLRDR